MKDFKTTALKIISDIVYKIESLDNDYVFDIDSSNDVFNIKTPKGVYVINTNSHLEEIWISSCISGPHHFKVNESGNWVNKNNIEMIELLDDEFFSIAKIKLR